MHEIKFIHNYKIDYRVISLVYWCILSLECVKCMFAPCFSMSKSNSSILPDTAFRVTFHKTRTSPCLLVLVYARLININKEAVQLWRRPVMAPSSQSWSTSKCEINHFQQYGSQSLMQRIRLR